MSDIKQIQCGGTLYDILDAKTLSLVCEIVENGATASQTLEKGTIILRNDKMYEVTTTIASGGTFTEGVNITETDVGEKLTQINASLSIKRAEVSATQATITTKIQQFYQALSVATDLQLRHAVIIRYGSNYNYVYRIESVQNDVYQFCSQQQNLDKNIILRTLNIKPSDSTAWLFSVSGASANTLTEQTTANDTSVWELYY